MTLRQRNREEARMDLPRALWVFVSVVTISIGSLGCESDKGDDKTKSNDNAGAADASESEEDADTAARDASSEGTSDAGTSSSSDAGQAGDAAGDAAADGATGDGGAAPDVDYTKAESWLCRPDRASDACDVDLDTTIVKADGTLQVEKFMPAANPAIDCFYVYPTVSLDTTANSDLMPGPEEEQVVRAQFARFASQCRLFAPMYRQVTLTSLRAAIAGMATMPDRTLGYRDVLAAWRWYMQNENKGRGVVLIGHSQGSGVIVQLIREQIDPDPTKVPLLAAFVPGTNLTVPQGQVVGGSFQKVPLCKAADELGCVVSYVSFRANAPPPSNTRFGTTMTAGQVVGCVNPANLAGGPAELHAYLSTSGAGASAAPMGAWVNGNDPSKMVTTPFVNVPGMLSAECKSDASGSYLAITVKGDSADPRVDDIVGDVVTNDMVQADWGLHLIDVHLTMGNMLDLVAAKAKKFQMK
jgi:hypothetical protein